MACAPAQLDHAVDVHVVKHQVWMSPFLRRTDAPLDMEMIMVIPRAQI